MVSIVNIICMGVAGLLSVILVIALCAFVKIKYKTSLKVCLLAAMGFFVFAGILESLMHQIVLAANPAIVNNIWLYAIYGGLAAGIFEETARFLIIKFLLKKEYANPYNAIMYGAGHGGFEVLLLMAGTTINNITYSLLINAHQTDLLFSQVPDAQKDRLQAVIDQLLTAKPYLFFEGYVERIPAVCIHIALSVIVWIAVTKKKTYLYPVAILLHALTDGAMVVIADKLKSLDINVFWVELEVYASAVIICIIAYLIWKKNKMGEANAELE